MIKLKKVDMTIELAYQLSELGFAISFKNGAILIERED